MSLSILRDNKNFVIQPRSIFLLISGHNVAVEVKSECMFNEVIRLSVVVVDYERLQRRTNRPSEEYRLIIAIFCKSAKDKIILYSSNSSHWKASIDSLRCTT